MIDIDTSGIEQFCKDALLEMARLDRDVSHIFYQWTTRIFVEMAIDSPQWSGDLTSNWNYSVHQPDYSYRMSPNKADGPKRKQGLGVGYIVYQRGMDPAVSEALTRMKTVPQPSWRDTVYISNATPIAPDVEAMTIRIRPVNLIEGQTAMINFRVMKEQQSGRIL